MSQLAKITISFSNGICSLDLVCLFIFDNRHVGGNLYIATGSKKLLHSSDHGQVEISVSYYQQQQLYCTGWGIKISHFSKGHCASCSDGREVGVVSRGWLASTIVSIHNGLDR